MARPTNYIDEAYVPTEPADTAAVIPTLIIPEGATPHLIDPCAGDGTALITLAQAWGIAPQRTWGIEINFGRFHQLAARLPEPNCLLADLTEVKCSQYAFDIIWDNAPYGDHDVVSRWETVFLNWSTHRLRSGGVHYWVVPWHQVQHEGNLTTLLAQYEIHQMWRTSLRQYKQVVVQAVKRPSPVIADDVMKAIVLAADFDNLPDAPTQPPLLLAANTDHDRPSVFSTGYVAPEALVAANTLALATQTRPRTASWHTVLPPSAAQMPAAMTATKATLALRVNGTPDGKLRTRYITATELLTRQVYEPVDTEDDKGRVRRKYIEDYIRVPAVKAMDEDGSVTTVTGQELGALIAQNLDTINAAIGRTITCDYAFDPTPEEIADVSQINLRRKIPNSDKSGLAPAQKHMTVANYRAVVRHKSALIGGRMGTGKTVIAIGVAAMLERRRRLTHSLIICPPTLVKKWMREIRVTHPDRRVRVFHLDKIRDVDEWLQRGGYGVVSSTRLSLGSSWEAAVWTGGKGLAIAREAKLDPAKPESFSKNPLPTERRLPGGRPRRRDDRPSRITQTFRPDAADSKRIPANTAYHAVRCPVCGAAQTDKNGNPYTVYALKTDDHLTCQACRTPLWHVTPKPARIPLGLYIRHAWGKHRKHAKPRPKLFVITDEAQEYKGEDSARGMWAASVCAMADYNAGLTGTPHGGYVGDTARMLARTNHAFRRKLLRNYGGWGKMFKAYVTARGSRRIIRSEKIEQRTSAYASRSAPHTREKELPSAAPSFILDAAEYGTFFNLQDVADFLPHLEERVLGIDLGPMKEEILAITRKLQELMAQSIARGSMKILSACIHAMLQIAENPFKAYRIPAADGKAAVTVGPLTSVRPDEMLPKEAWLVAEIQKELAAKRKVLVTLQMTDTTDITERLITILKAHGISAAKVTVEPSKREEWLQNQGLKYDVLFSHPQRVMTGLDLLNHPTIVMLQWDYSILRELQVAARSYRMGQLRPVRVLHTPYAQSAQMAAVKLLAMKAAADALLTSFMPLDADVDGLICLADTAVITQLGQQVLDEARRRGRIVELEKALGTTTAEQEEALLAELQLLRRQLHAQDSVDDGIVSTAVGGTLTNVAIRDFPAPAEPPIPENEFWGNYGDAVLAQGSALRTVPEATLAGPAEATAPADTAATGATEQPGSEAADGGEAAGAAEVGDPETDTQEASQAEEPAAAATGNGEETAAANTSPAPAKPAKTTHGKRVPPAANGRHKAAPGRPAHAPAAPAAGVPATANTATRSAPPPHQAVQMSLFDIKPPVIITDHKTAVEIRLSHMEYNHYAQKARPLPHKEKIHDGRISGKGFPIHYSSEANHRFIVLPGPLKNGRARGYIVQSTLLAPATAAGSDDPYIGALITGTDRVDYVIAAPADLAVA